MSAFMIAGKKEGAIVKRFVVLVLDGFGIGAMKDAAETRPGDERADTLGSILKDFPQMNFQIWNGSDL